jgi:hypothetical protein
MSYSVNRKIVLDVLKNHVPSSGQAVKKLLDPDNKDNTVVTALNVT